MEFYCFIFYNLNVLNDSEFEVWKKNYGLFNF